MKNKGIVLLLAGVMCAGCFAACGGGDKGANGNSDTNDGGDGKMTEAQWKEEITPTIFSATNISNVGIYDVQIDVNGNAFYKRAAFENNGDYAERSKTYIKRSDNTYKVSIRDAGSNYKWQTEMTTEAEYQNNYDADIAPFVKVLTYFENNFDKFTCIKNEFGQTNYELTIEGSGIEENINAVKAIMNVSNIETTKVVAINFEDGLSIRFANGNNPYVISLWFDIPVFESVYSFANVKDYTIAAGENTDGDYCVTKVTEEGFMQYYPNQTDGIGDSAVCAKQITEGQHVGEYQVYTRQGSSWVATTPQTPDYYKEYTFDTYVSRYFYDVTSQVNFTNRDLYEVAENFITLKDNYTFTCRRWTHTYKDFQITINEDFEIVSVTLQVSTHDSATNTDSGFIPVTLTVGNTTIDFPQN
ncbi:MAG: hypothetical protein IJD77_01630 [Clostridia bacterium]|nr:hypothetical protein [Clostridia bacterium]